MAKTSLAVAERPLAREMVRERTFAALSDQTQLVYRVIDHGEELDVVFDWSTPLSASELLRLCEPFRLQGGEFRHEVEVLVYGLKPNRRKPWQPEEMSVQDFLGRAESIDRSASAVRFNADTQLGDFSITWQRAGGSGNPRVQAVFGRTPDMMRSMLEDSAPSQSDRRRIRDLLRRVRQIEHAINLVG